MSSLLYVPAINPPTDVLHHAILYRDNITSLTPEEAEWFFSKEVKIAKDAGLYEATNIGTLLDKQGKLRDGNPSQGKLKEWEALESWAEPLLQCSGIDDEPIGHKAHWILAFRRAIGLTEIDLETTIELNTLQMYARLLIARELVRIRRESPERGPVIPHYVLTSSSRQSGTQPSTESSREHLLAQVDVGRLLPDSLPKIKTSTLIAFRERRNDERRHLLNAVERLIEQHRQTYNSPGDIERSAKRDVAEALDNMQKAGRGFLKGWSRRIVSVITAAGATTSSTVATGAPAVVTVGASLASGLAINIATNPVPTGWWDDQYKNYHYLYRIQRKFGKETDQ